MAVTNNTYNTINNGTPINISGLSLIDKMNFCAWHPIYSDNEISDVHSEWSLREFGIVLTIVNNFKDNLDKRCSDCPRKYLDSDDEHNQIYEINMRNRFRSDKHIDYSSWWVDTKDWKDWWLSPREQILIQKYGWTIDLV